jgi:hypothetical protein
MPVTTMNSGGEQPEMAGLRGVLGSVAALSSVHLWNSEWKGKVESQSATISPRGSGPGRTVPQAISAH